MKPEDVRVAWMQAFVDAYCRADGAWVVDGDRTRAAIAAVIPLVQKKEREACRREAVAVAHTFPQDDPRHETGWVVADAIRARGGA